MNSHVTIVFPDNSGTRVGTARVPWMRGKSLQRYLHEYPLKSEGLIARSKRCYIYKDSGEKVRLQYELKAGERITFVYAPRTSK